MEGNPSQRTSSRGGDKRDSQELQAGLQARQLASFSLSPLKHNSEANWDLNSSSWDVGGGRPQKLAPDLLLLVTVMAVSNYA